MPRVFDVAKKGGTWVNVPSALMDGAPTVATTGGKQVVTYQLNPKAVWSDGEPITSADFKYTWDQIVTGDDIYDTTGYSSIGSIDDSDPQTVIATFSEPFGGWSQLFGGLYGVFPSHLLEGKDRDAEMANGYDWSGGPYLAEWDKGVSVTLTPNDKYWGPKAKSTIVFKFLADTAAEFQAFQSGEVSAIYPQPQLDAVDAINAGLPDAKSYVTADTGNVEALWINNEAPPFDDVAVRQAFAYAIDRNAIVKRLFGGLGVTKAVNSLNPPILSAYSDPNAYAGYGLDLKKVAVLMKGAGWAKADGVWEKDGEKAELTIKSTTGNKRRELTEQILQAQLKAAGFDLTIENQAAADLFGEQLPAGDYQLALYAQVATSLEPGLCSIMCSKNIPTDANDNTGQNWTRTNVKGLDAPLKLVDTSSDNDARAKAGKQADQIMAKAQVSLPLDPLPNIALWSKSVKGPKGDNPIFAMFYNLSTWTQK